MRNNVERLGASLAIGGFLPFVCAIPAIQNVISHTLTSVATEDQVTHLLIQAFGYGVMSIVIGVLVFGIGRMFADPPRRR